MLRSSSRLTVIAALALACLATAPGPSGADPTVSTETTASVEKYLGTWNYDQPDHVTRANIASMDLYVYRPDIPQIGTITFTRGAGDEVIGHTDQGCTWHFRPAGDALEMSSTTQYCFNHVIGSGYNIDRWRVIVEDGVERETLHANSYLGPGPSDSIWSTAAAPMPPRAPTPRGVSAAPGPSIAHPSPPTPPPTPTSFPCRSRPPPCPGRSPSPPRRAAPSPRIPPTAAAGCSRPTGIPPSCPPPPRPAARPR